MKILVVSEKFLNGGLERQILTQKAALPDVEFFYAFGAYQEDEAIDKKSVTILESGQDVAAFLKNVETLKALIEREKIDAVHAHPFFSFYYALFAAYLTGTPICYSVHGYGSVHFPYRINSTVLLSYFLNELDAPVFCVSRRYAQSLENSFGRKAVYFLPNSLDTERYGECDSVKGAPWALVSRLDVDKLPEIKLVIENMERLGIDKLDVIGSGSCEEELKALAADKAVRFPGYSSTVHKDLKRGYRGVIGVGQTVLEGLASNLPVLLIGDGRITGLVDRARYEIIKEQNFVNRFISDDGLEEIAQAIGELDKTLPRYRLRESVAREFEARSVWARYLETLKNAEITPNHYFARIYEMLVSARENGEVSGEEDFYASETVYAILKRYLYGYSMNKNVLDDFFRCDLLADNRRACAALMEAQARVESLSAQLRDKEERLNRAEYELNELRNHKIFRAAHRVKHPFQKSGK